MVDRITPKTTPEESDRIAKTFGVADRWPVVADPFRQWVIEDQFSNGRPPLDEVGAEFVTDVAPHKLVKMRMLNGSHCALSYLGILLGHQTTDMAMRDPKVCHFVDQLLRAELRPLLVGTADVDLDEYCTTVRTRLANQGVPDHLSRLAARGSTKMPSYLLPSLRQARDEGRPTTLLTLAVAAWLRYLRGYDLTGRPIVVEDARARQLSTLAKTGLGDPRPLLAVRDIFGDLGDDAVVVAALERMLRDIDHLGLEATLAKALSGQHIAHNWQEEHGVAAT
jgi:mannitol-1-phosphate/altronate dehydrogenase